MRKGDDPERVFLRLLISGRTDHGERGIRFGGSTIIPDFNDVKPDNRSHLHRQGSGGPVVSCQTPLIMLYTRATNTLSMHNPHNSLDVRLTTLTQPVLSSGLQDRPPQHPAD